MSNVLFDVPGPRTRARHRIYSLVAGALLLAALVGLVLFLQDRGELAYDLWEPFVTPEYLEALLVDGLLNTLKMAATAVLMAVVLGVVLGVGKLSDHRFVRWPCWLVVEFFRAVPLLLLIVFVFFTYGTGDGIGSYWSVVIGLTLYNGAVLAEVFRAGVLAVPRGQAEAAYALGMRKTQVMVTVLLPQAVKIMLPAIISQCVVALKDTSLGYYVLAPGLTTIGRSIWTEFGNQFQTATVLAAMYIVVNLLLSALATWVQRRLVGEKAPLAGLAAGAQAGGGGGGAAVGAGD
ncbi:amino acid ABC transporter permease [Nocardioides sp. SOB77]|uniref:Amino acid ABC transporter permease n=1 Tax=Nocardioides oceani TaxID=3058369 RepID=A0ABT8FAA6_9ACTN|nr:amino acid ABC transporter permease [Nocardioides oceani]MDN4171578.1 amino acid ABC transporter permease [Nocardioides oceani]